MEIIPKVLVAGGALGFLLAVVGALIDPPLLQRIADPESFSRACDNLVLMAIALTLMAKTSKHD